MNYTEMLKEFHRKFNHTIADKPSLPIEKIVDLRFKLIDEEFSELREAMYAFLAAEDDGSEGLLIRVADALADLLYVVFGTAVTYGIPIDEVFAEVHKSNMTKSGKKNKYGKTVKGKEYIKPDLRKIIFQDLQATDPNDHP